MVSTPQRKYFKPEEMPVDAPRLIWEEIPIGVKLGPVEFRIKPSTHQRHGDLLDIHLPWFEALSYLFPWEMQCAPRVISAYYGRMNRGLEASHSFRFYKPVKVGEPLVGYNEVLDKFEKRGKKCQITKATTYDSKGDLVVELTSENVDLGKHEGVVPSGTLTKQRQQEGGWDDPGQLVKASKDLPIGFVLLTYTRGPCPMRHGPTGFDKGGWDKKLWRDNMHEDGFARKLGFRGGIVEGPVGSEYANLQQMVNFFGPESFFTTGTYTFKTCGPVYTFDVLVAKARVKEKVPEAGKTRLVLESRIERIDGDMVRIGTVSALVD